MGTSSAYGGPNNNTPLIPSWLDSGVPESSPVPENPPTGGDGQEMPQIPIEGSTPLLTIPTPIIPNRFRTARSNMTRFAASDGADRGGLYRGVSQYVSKSSGGAHQAARRMGSSRRSASRLLGFLSNVVSQGAEEALRVLNLGELAGNPIGDIFLGMMEYICPDGGNLDEGIARDAFIETIVDLTENGITDLDTLSIEQLGTVFELYVTHTIESRIYNDIATKVIQLPSNAHLVTQIQTQLQDLIRRGVADAVANQRASIQSLRQDNVRNLVNQVYETTFTIVQNICNIEAEALAI
jgi:hypothetical protein